MCNIPVLLDQGIEGKYQVWFSSQTFFNYKSPTFSFTLLTIVNICSESCLLSTFFVCGVRKVIFFRTSVRMFSSCIKHPNYEVYSQKVFCTTFLYEMFFFSAQIFNFGKLIIFHFVMYSKVFSLITLTKFFFYLWILNYTVSFTHTYQMKLV